MVQLKRWLAKGLVGWLGVTKIGPSRRGDDHVETGAKAPVEERRNTEQLPDGDATALRAKGGGGLQPLLEDHQDLLQEIPRGEAKHRAIKHHINALPRQLPTYPKQGYDLSNSRLLELKSQLRDLLEERFIVTPSQSPIAAPVYFVGERDGSLRMVIDYRSLNGIAIKDENPLPRVADLIDRWERLAGSVSWTCSPASTKWKLRSPTSDNSTPHSLRHLSVYCYASRPGGCPVYLSAPHAEYFLEQLDDSVVF